MKSPSRLPTVSRRLLGASLALVLVSISTLAAQPSQTAGTYDDLVDLYQEFREFQRPVEADGVPDYSATTMKKKYQRLAEYQQQLAAIGPAEWPVSEQVDYHLVRAEMNGMEFQHRVLHPWSRDPSFYGSEMLELWRLPRAPLTAEDAAQIKAKLEFLPGLYAQAQVNLANVEEVPVDFAILAMHDLEEVSARLEAFTRELADHHPDLLSKVAAARTAMDDYVTWLESKRDRMASFAGVGIDNYNWLLKNVYLFPYTWEECLTMVQLEDNRVITFQRLEENRNRNLPPIEPVQSQADYKASVEVALEHIMDFLVEEQIFTVEDWMVTDECFGSWHGFDNPWPEKHDYFFNFSHREPVMEETHEYVGHHIDELRDDQTEHPIRSGRRPYKISTARAEGFAFALEELLMHAGYLDERPQRGREIAYEQSAFRTVRALADLHMHSGDWTLTEAMEYAVANAPHGHLLEDSPHLWFEMQTTLVGVGHHMLMVAGKVHFMKLLRDRAQQLGEEFTVKGFLDEFFASGMIPMSLTRWEMTGFTDEMDKLLPGETEGYDFSGDLEDLFYDHPAWASREAQIVQAESRASLTATGTHISEAWKTWHEPLPWDRDWSISVDVTVPLAWDSMSTQEAQVGAGPWIGRLDPEGKGRRVYEVNLATIANEVRFVQGQLIENRLGEDPIAVGHIMVPDETMRLEISYRAEPPSITLTANGKQVDSRTLDSAGLDDWGMSGDDVFYVGIMGFAENSDLTQHPVTLDNFEVTLDR